MDQTVQYSEQISKNGKTFHYTEQFFIFGKLFSKSGQGCKRPVFGHRLIKICGEAATTTLNPEPFTPFTFHLQSKPDLYSTYSFLFTSIL